MVPPKSKNSLKSYVTILEVENFFGQSHITGTQSFPILLALRASEVSSIDNENHTVDDLSKAVERQSDEESTGNVSSEIEETLAKI